MSNVIPFDYYRAYGKVFLRLQEVRDLLNRQYADDALMLYHVDRLVKAVEDLKKAHYEFQGTVLLAQLEASVKQQGGNQ